jgi:acetyl-CoA acetyltransferase
MPYGIMTPGQCFALIANRYLHKYNADPLYFAAVKIALSRYAARNPRATIQRVLTMGDYLGSRFIAWPLRMMDFCLESDGGIACVLTSAERAKDLKQRPVYISSFAQGSGPKGAAWMIHPYRDDITITEAAYIADDLFARGEMSRDDIDVAQIYDAFTPMVLMVLEDLGFCKRGEAGTFVAEGNLDLDGKLPTNTSGGQLCEGYMHGMNLLAEGVRQLRGTSTSQVENAETCLVTSGIGFPTAALILRR